MKINMITIRDAHMSPDVKDFAENFAGMSISFLLNYFSKYDNITLHEESRDMIAIQMLVRLLCQVILLQETMNSVT